MSHTTRATSSRKSNLKVGDFVVLMEKTIKKAEWLYGRARGKPLKVRSLQGETMMWVINDELRIDWIFHYNEIEPFDPTNAGMYNHLRNWEEFE